MTLLTNRSNVRTNLKIDPKKKIWSDATLDRFINEGQRWVLNDSSVNFQVGESIGYLIPVLDYQEYRTSTDDNPENFFSPKIKQLLRANASTGTRMEFGRGPVYTNSTVTAPSVITQYAQRLFLNAGYQDAATYTTIHNMDTFDGNGTWAGTNDATTVATDSTTFKEGSGSVSFTIDVSNSTANKATLTNSDMAAVDLSSFQLNDGGIILWSSLTSATDIKAIEVLFGSDSSNYHAVKQYATDVQGANYADGWNRIFLPTVNRQTVGTPDLSAIDYVQVNVIFDSGETDQAACLIDNIQYVNKYIRYWYARKSTSMSSDSDESVVPSDYQFVYELYATFKALSTIKGKEQSSDQFFNEANLQKNIMIEELQWNQPQEYLMPPR